MYCLQRLGFFSTDIRHPHPHIRYHRVSVILLYGRTSMWVLSYMRLIHHYTDESAYRKLVLFLVKKKHKPALKPRFLLHSWKRLEKFSIITDKNSLRSSGASSFAKNCRRAFGRNWFSYDWSSINRSRISRLKTEDYFSFMRKTKLFARFLTVLSKVFVFLRRGAFLYCEWIYWFLHNYRRQVDDRWSIESPWQKRKSKKTFLFARSSNFSGVES